MRVYSRNVLLLTLFLIKMGETDGHKAEKQAFDQLDGQKVPSRQALHEEFNRLLVEKKQAYAEYRQVKKEMQEYLIAKQTVEHILGIDRHKRVEEKKQQKEEQR